MSQFLFENLRDVFQNTAQCSNVCICCLDRENDMIRLRSCGHTDFLLYSLEVKIDLDDYFVCRHCHYLLQKIDKFRHQVEKSFEFLNTKTENVRRDTEIIPTSILCLGIKPVEIFDSTLPLSLLPFACKDATDDDTKDVEIKLESDIHFSGSESDVPLLKIKQENCESKPPGKKQKATKKKIKKKNNKESEHESDRFVKTRDNYSSLFKLVQLTEEEVKEERSKLATDASYLRFPYKCSSCIVGYDFEINLIEHNEKIHNCDKPFKCEICLSMLGSEGSYKEHVRRHSKRYECLKCKKRVVTMESVRNHCLKKHGVQIRTRMFSCKKCNFTTEKARVYRYHLDKHKEKPQCTECGKTFINASILKNHMLTVHNHSNHKFVCVPCDKTYSSRSGLCAHNADHHSGTESTKAFCEKCGSWFQCQRNLDVHLRTSLRHRSHAENSYKCNDCPKGYRIKSQLQEHISYVHLNNTAYKCALCGDKSFLNRTALKRHVANVHEKSQRPRNKMCDYCGRGFTSNTILRTHIRTHTGERPLHCTRCAATFAHPGALYTHQRLLHSGSSNVASTE